MPFLLSLAFPPVTPHSSSAVTPSGSSLARPEQGSLVTPLVTPYTCPENGLAIWVSLVLYLCLSLDCQLQWAGAPFALPPTSPHHTPVRGTAHSMPNR